MVVGKVWRSAKIWSFGHLNRPNSFTWAAIESMSIWRLPHLKHCYSQLLCIIEYHPHRVGFGRGGQSNRTQLIDVNGE